MTDSAPESLVPAETTPPCRRRTGPRLGRSGVEVEHVLNETMKGPLPSSAKGTRSWRWELIRRPYLASP